MSLREFIIIVLKLGISGAIIAALAVGFIVISGEGDISEAQATIFDLQTEAAAEHEDFERVMEESGLEPSPYDMNGNHVQFAAADSPLSPMELSENYQRRLQRAGINSKVYNQPLIPSDGHHASPQEILGDTEQVLEQMDAFLSGELVPITMEDDYVTMGGLVPDRDFDGDEEEFREQWQANMRDNFEDGEELFEHLQRATDIEGIDFEDNIAGFRFLDAQRQDHPQMQSQVTATWSDNDFDASRMNDPQAMERRPGAEVPACIGCERSNRLEALNEDEPYVLNQFHTSAPSHDVGQFYREAMQNRDWQPSESDQIINEFAAHVPELQQMSGETMTFERGEESLTIYISEDPNDRHTEIVSMMESQ